MDVLNITWHLIQLPHDEKPKFMISHLKERRSESLVIVAAYLFLIFVGQNWMQYRPKYNLRIPLIIWNLALSAFSLAGAVPTLKYLWNRVSEIGLTETACDPTFYHHENTSLWSILFIVSKVPELFDTIFIVLRKQKLIFLHWYHHASVVIFAFYSYPEQPGMGVWFMTMNYTIHSVMYFYYALRAMKFVPPKVVNILITSSQILQMVIATVGNIYVYWRLTSGQQCGKDTLQNTIFQGFFYFSYWVLFLHFFLNTYVWKAPTTPTIAVENEKSLLSKPNSKLYKKDI